MRLPSLTLASTLLFAPLPAQAQTVQPPSNTERPIDKVPPEQRCDILDRAAYFDETQFLKRLQDVYKLPVIVTDNGDHTFKVQIKLIDSAAIDNDFVARLDAAIDDYNAMNAYNEKVSYAQKCPFPKAQKINTDIKMVMDALVKIVEATMKEDPARFTNTIASNSDSELRAEI